MNTTQRNVVICGAPRSGTSMLAEIFTEAQYHAGRDLIPSAASNPHGFFEDIRVNRRNDEMMTPLEVARPGPRLPRDLWWMEALDGPVPRRDDAPWRDLVPPAPFVMKDPRFVYTGPAWSTAWSTEGASALVIVLVCPIGEVTRSLETMRAQQPDLFTSLPSAELQRARHVATMWRAMYRSVLAWVDHEAVFVTEASVRTGAALAGLGRVAGTTLTTSTVDPALHRHTRTGRHVAEDATAASHVPFDECPDDDPAGVGDQVMRRVRRDAARLRRAAGTS